MTLENIINTYGIYMFVAAVLFFVIVAVSCLAAIGHNTWCNMCGKRRLAKDAARELKISTDEALRQFQEWLHKAEKLCQTITTDKVQLITAFPLGCSLNDISASSDTTKTCITFSAKWFHLAVLDPDRWGLAFMQSVGHELGHKKDITKGGIRFHFRPRAEKEFFCWTQEVFCDFYGIKCTSGFKGNALEAMKAKAKKYMEQEIKRPWFSKFPKIQWPWSYATHPSWSFRSELIETYPVFCDAVIDKVAKAAGCDNQAFIAELKDKYRNI